MNEPSHIGEILGMLIGAVALGYFVPLYAPRGTDGKRQKTILGVIGSSVVLFTLALVVWAIR